MFLFSGPVCTEMIYLKRGSGFACPSSRTMEEPERKMKSGAKRVTGFAVASAGCGGIGSAQQREHCTGPHIK